MWHPKRSNRFERSYERLNEEIANQVDEALRRLLSSERPELLGISKMGSRKSYFSWELGRSCRILYRPEYSERIIEFFRLCSHKEAYGP